MANDNNYPKIKSISINDLFDETKVKLLNEITDEYPEMNEEEANRLKSDILFNKKVNMPLLAVENDDELQIFDGRNRYKVLKEIYNDNTLKDQIKDLQIPIEIHKGELDSIKLIADSYNLSRRHLTSKQKTILAFSDRFKQYRKDFSQTAKENQYSGVQQPKEKRSNFNKSLAETVGTNSMYISRWKNVDDLLNGKDIYEELRVLAFKDTDNFDEIVKLLTFPKILDIDFEDEETQNKIISMCNDYVALKKKQVEDDENSETEEEIIINIDELRKKNQLPVTPKTKKEKEQPEEKEFWVYINSSTIDLAIKRRIVIALKDVLEKDNIKDFKCYFPKDVKNSIKLDNQMVSLLTTDEEESLPDEDSDV